MTCTHAESQGHPETKYIPMLRVRTAILLASLFAAIALLLLPPIAANAVDQPVVDAADAIDPAADSEFYGPGTGNPWPDDLPSTATIREQFEYAQEKGLRELQRGGYGPESYIRTDNFSLHDDLFLRQDHWYFDEAGNKIKVSQFHDLSAPTNQRLRAMIKADPENIDRAVATWKNLGGGVGGADDSAPGGDVGHDSLKNAKGRNEQARQEWQQTQRVFSRLERNLGLVREAISKCRTEMLVGQPVSSMIDELKVHVASPEWRELLQVDQEEIAQLEKDFQQQVIEPRTAYRALDDQQDAIVASLEASCDFEPARRDMAVLYKKLVDFKPDKCKQRALPSDVNFEQKEAALFRDYRAHLKDGQKKLDVVERDFASYKKAWGKARCNRINELAQELENFKLGEFQGGWSRIKNTAACDLPDWAVEERGQVEGRRDRLLADVKNWIAEEDKDATKFLRAANDAIAEPKCDARSADQQLVQFADIGLVCDDKLVSQGKELRTKVDALRLGTENYTNAITAAHSEAKQNYDNCGGGEFNTVDVPVPAESCYEAALSDEDRTKINDIRGWNQENREAELLMAKLDRAIEKAPKLNEVCKHKGALTSMAFWRASEHKEGARIDPRDCVETHQTVRTYEDLKKKIEGEHEEYTAKRKELEGKRLIARSKREDVANASPPQNRKDAADLMKQLEQSDALIREIRSEIGTDESMCFTDLVAEIDKVERTEIPLEVRDAMAVMLDPEAVQRAVATGSPASSIGEQAPEPRQEVPEARESRGAAAAEASGASGDESGSEPATDPHIALARQAIAECRIDDAEALVALIQSVGGRAGVLPALSRLRESEALAEQKLAEAQALEAQGNYMGALQILQSIKSSCASTNQKIGTRIALAQLAEQQRIDSLFANAQTALDSCDYQRFLALLSQLPEGERKTALQAQKALAEARDATVNDLYHQGTSATDRGAFSEAVANLEKANGMAQCAIDRTRVLAALARARQGEAQFAALQCGPNMRKIFNADAGAGNCVCEAGFVRTASGNGCSDPVAEARAQREAEQRRKAEQEEADAYAAWAELMRVQEQMIDGHRRSVEDDWRRARDGQGGHQPDSGAARRDEQQARSREEDRYGVELERQRWEEDQYRREMERRRRQEEENLRRWEEERRAEIEWEREQERQWDEIERWSEDQWRREEDERRQRREEDQRGLRDLENGGRGESDSCWGGDCDFGTPQDLCADGTPRVLGGPCPEEW